MGLGRIIKRIVPTALKRIWRREIEEIARQQMAPRMVYGYRDASGTWRPRTRLSNTVFINKPHRLSLADNVYVGHWAILDATRRIEIGEGTQIGAWAGLFTHSSHFAIRLYGRHYLEVPEDEKLFYNVGEIKIGRYVFISSGAQIMPGVTIGDGAIISSGTRVARDVKPFSMVGPGGKIYPRGAQQFDMYNLNRSGDEQLRQWYEEWQAEDESRPAGQDSLGNRPPD